MLLLLIVRCLVLVPIALMFCFPLVFMVVSMFKPDQQLLYDSGTARAFLPVGDLSFTNYTEAFARAPVGLFIFNSVLVTAVTLSQPFCSTAGFAFTFMEWRGRKLAFTVILAALIVPFETIAIPLLLASTLPWIGLEEVTFGWLNSDRVQIVSFLADDLTIYLFAQNFIDLPGELIEAARAEGATSWQVYRKNVMRFSGPVLGTATVLTFLALHNQSLWPLMVVQDEGCRPVMVDLQYVLQLNIAWGEVLAFYLYLQKASIASTGVKG